MAMLEAQLGAALRAVDQDCRWDLIDGLMDECPDDVLEAAVGLLGDGDERARTLGADVLGRLLASNQADRARALASLDAALVTETADTTIASLVAALGHGRDEASMPRILELATHPCAEVRLAVAFAVATIESEQLSPEARQALILLSRDEEPEVRDWATFGLGTLSAADGPDVRAALLARAEDRNRQTRAEALFGLAVRNDPRAVPHLIRALESFHVDGLEVDAAAAAGDRRLLPALRALQNRSEADQAKLSRAIDRCSGEVRRELLT
jgi:HEAT repeat protein